MNKIDIIFISFALALLGISLQESANSNEIIDQINNTNNKLDSLSSKTYINHLRTINIKKDSCIKLLLENASEEDKTEVSKILYE